MAGTADSMEIETPAPSDRKAKGKNVMKIMVVDDHALFRQGMSMMLGELYPGSSIIEAATSDEALEAAESNPDTCLVLLDLKLESGSGLDVLERLVTMLPNAPVAVVSASEDSRDISMSYKSGAKGYIVKSSTSDTLRHALPLILSGETFIPSSAMAMLTGAKGGQQGGTGRGPGGDNVPSLTPRQYEILQLMAEGMQNKDIAGELGMLEGTVKVHVKSILQKLGVNNRTHAVVTGIRQGLVPASVVLPESQSKG